MFCRSHYLCNAAQSKFYVTKKSLKGGSVGNEADANVGWPSVQVQPTNEGGSMTSLPIPPTGSGWIVQVQPTMKAVDCFFESHPREVGGLFILSLHKRPAGSAFPNPTNEVGGSFILSLPKRPPGFPKSHQRSWWIVHTQPTGRLAHAPSQIPPTQVGGLFILSLTASSKRLRERNPDLSCRMGMNNPPTARRCERSGV